MSLKMQAEISAQEPAGKDDSVDGIVRIITDDEDDHSLRLEFEVKGDEKNSVMVVDKDDFMEAIARVAGVSFGESVPKQEVL